MPFLGLTMGQIYMRVVHDNGRPTLDAFTAAKERCAQERPALVAYTDLLQCCWSAERSSRPSFKEVRCLVHVESPVQSR